MNKSDNLNQAAILWADVPDPDVIRVQDTYYMTSTTMYFTPGCPIMKSTDLVNWEIVNYVYDVLSDGDAFTLTNGKNDYGRGSWASCLRYHNGIYYVFMAAYNTDKTYIFQTTDIENGTWERYTLDGIYHDMSVLFDNNRVYMIYGVGTIKVIELTANATAVKPNGLDKIIIQNADITGENSLAEGSHIYKINDKYYIFIICWPKTGSQRRIQVCYRANALDGEYIGKIVLDNNLGFQNAGVAQGGIVETASGDWYAMLFQDHGAVGRIPVTMPVQWQDDWPIFGDLSAVQYSSFNGVVTSGFSLKTAAKNYAAQNDTSYKTDNPANQPNGSNLALQWQWNHNPDNRFWSLTDEQLRLTTGNVCTSLLDARNTLTQRTCGVKCCGTVIIDVSNMQNGDFAGLAALQEDYGFIGVKMVDNKKSLIMASFPNTTEVEIIPIGENRENRENHENHEKHEKSEINEQKIHLKVDFNFATAANAENLANLANLTDTAEFYYSPCGKQWQKLGKTLKLSYKLSHFTGYRFALFNYATKTTGGYVDFSHFVVEASV